jgi:DNA-binding Lrp family transcriptional regulator
MKAYMLINCARDQALAVAEASRGVTGVLDADAITGEFDVVVTLEAGDLSELRAVMTGVQRIGGILKTTTCLALD